MFPAKSLGKFFPEKEQKPFIFPVGVKFIKVQAIINVHFLIYLNPCNYIVDL
jgi:hypothetical protein